MSNGKQNPFDALAEQGKTPVTAEQHVAEQGGNPFDELAHKTSPNPFDSLVSPPESLSRRVAAGESVPPRSFAEQHPLIQNLLVRPFQGVAEGVYTFLRDMTDRSVRAQFEGIPTGATQPKGPIDMTKPIRTPDYYESYGEFLNRRASEGDMESREKLNLSLEGAAFMGSFLGASALKLIPGAPRVMGRAASFLTGEFLGGNIYGAIRPLQPGESRPAAILSDGATFAVAGGVIQGSAWAFKRYIMALPRARRIAALRYAKGEFDKLNENLAPHGTSLESLPPDKIEPIEATILGQAIHEAEPGAINLDEIVRAETDRAIEPTPRLEAERGALVDEPSPGERALKLPEVSFREALQQVEPLRGPQKVEPVVPPKGFQAGAPSEGQPTLETTQDRIKETAEQAFTVGEPRKVTLPEPPVKGLEPTEIGAEAKGVPGDIAELALTDAAVDDAVERIDPLDVSSPEVRGDATLTQLLVGDPVEPGRGSEVVRKALDRALTREGSAAEESVVLDLSHPQPWEVDLGKKKSAKEIEQVRKGLKSALARERAPIEVQPHEQVGAPWNDPPDVAESLVNPMKMDGFQIGAYLDDKELEELTKKIKSQAGHVSGRLLLGVGGAGLDWLSFDENLPPSARAGLFAVGTFMLAGAASPRIAEWMKNTNFTKKLIALYNPTKMMSDPHSVEAFRQYVDAMTYSRTLAKTHGDMLAKTFPDAASQRAAMFVVEEGAQAPEWAILRPDQQQAALALNQMNLRLGVLLKQNGVLDEYIENYITHRLPPESFQRWKVNGFRTFPTGGPLTQRRKILGLRELEQWTQSNGLEGPIFDLPKVQGSHIAEAYKAIGAARLRGALERIGMITDAPTTGMTVIPDNWRQIRIANMGKKIAPNEVAQALENISNPALSDREWVNSLDTAKGLWMRGVMFWFWEHGLNVLRSLPAVATNPFGYGEALRAIKANDPGIMEAAKHGLDLFSRPDFGVRAHEGWQRTLGRIGYKDARPLSGLAARMDRLQEIQDKILWDKIVPSLQYFAYSTKMHEWAEATKGVHLPGSIEYKTAARKAADFGNLVAGRIPQELVDPTLARRLRLILFSPQWTASRIALTANAAGELGEIASGRLNHRDAMYLPFKMRQLLWGAAITYVGSKILSGKEPEFNPNTSKFYMRTGLHGANGKEVGLDMLGWWQTDLQVLNHPLNFIANRLNPAIKTGYETVSGRDSFGRSMSPSQNIANIFSSLGPLPEAFSMAARVLRPGPKISKGEMLQAGSRLLATGNVASLPRPMDVVIDRMARKLLRGQKLPQNDENVFDLSRILRSNLLNGKELFDNRVITLLAYKKRGFRASQPGAAALESLWQTTRRAFAEY